jgi:Ca-activated chloride channel family protein
MMTAFHFLRPFWLLALLPGVLLWWLSRRRADPTLRWREAIDPDLLRHLVVGAPTGGWLRPRDALLAAWVVGTLAVAGPTWQREPSPFAADAPPVMLVLRVTPSMQATDLAPSRLERAKEKIADLLALEPGQAFGLIAYAGTAHLVLPPTRDASVVNTMARALSPDIMPRQGDALADAIALARRVLAEGGAGGSVLVLADEAASGQSAAALRGAGGNAAPVALLAILPRGRSPGAGLREAAAALGTDIVTATVDDADVAAIAGHFAHIGAVQTRPGEAVRWRDAGWYLVPVLALVVLLWFRRGWVVLG